MDFAVRITICRRRRRIAMRAVSNREVEILTPVALPEHEVARLLKHHEKAITKMLGAFREKRLDFSEGENFFYRGELYPIKNTVRMTGFDRAFLLPAVGDRRAALEKIYRRLAEEYIVDRARFLAAKFGIAIGKVHISGAQRRYGSCSSTGNCNFSWRLIQFPDDLIDYVICHELAHRFRMDHSAVFYAHLEKLFPGAADKKVQLRHFTMTKKLI